MKIRTQIVTEVEVDLAGMPFMLWPKEAQNAARIFLSRHSRHLQFRKIWDQEGKFAAREWLAFNVEADLALQDDLNFLTEL